MDQNTHCYWRDNSPLQNDVIGSVQSNQDPSNIFKIIFTRKD